MSFKPAKGTTGLIAIDDGGSSTCVATKYGYEKFYSVKGLYGERHLTQATSKYDFIVEYLGEKYVMGSLAKYDCALPMEMHTESKNNLFFDLSVLVAIHQYGYMSNYVVTSTPVEMFTKEEQEQRIASLRRSHTLTVNGVTKTFAITDLKLAAETASAFWINEPKGKSRFIDLGSRTIGYATTLNEDGVIRFLDTESGTYFGKGLEALEKNYTPKSLADYVGGRLVKSWGKNDKVYLLGGGALREDLVENIKRYFPNAEVMDDPQMANVKGMYILGRNLHGVH